MSIDRDALRAWLEASCLAQGVPLLVTERGTVARVGVLLRGRDAAGLPRSGDPSTRLSQPPAGNDPVRIHHAASAHTRRDRGEIENSADDGSLPGEVQ